MSKNLIVITIITTKLLGTINKYLKKQNNMSTNFSFHSLWWNCQAALVAKKYLLYLKKFLMFGIVLSGTALDLADNF